MALRGVLRKSEPVRDEHFVEIDHDHVASDGAVPVRIEKIDDYIDVEKVQKSVREGAIVFVGIKGLKNKDMTELKRAVERLRKTVTALNGDIAGVDENYLVVCPNTARVDRSEAKQL